MGNFEDAEKAYVTALLSEGSALRENDAYMQSIEAHQAQLKAQWEQLVLSVPFDDLEKSLLSVTTALLKFANSALGQAVIKATAASVAFGAMMFALQALIPVILSATAAMLANPIFWGAVAVGGVMFLVSWIDSLTESYGELTESLKDNVSEMKSSQTTIDSLTDKIKEIDKVLSQIEDKKLSITDEDELKTLNNQTSQLKNQESLLKSQLVLEQQKLETLQKEAQLKASNLFDERQSGYTTKSYNVYDFSNASPYEEGSKSTQEGNTSEALNQEITNVTLLEERIQSLTEQLDNLKAAHQENSEEAVNLANEINDLNTLAIEERNAMNEDAQTMITASEAGYEFTEAQQAVLDRYNELPSTIDKASNSFNNYNEEEEEAVEHAQAVSEAFDKAVKPLSDIENNYSLVSKAMTEFNEKGGISASTIKKLAELDSKWLSVLQMKDGQLTVDKELVTALAKAEQDQAIASLQAQASQDMYNISIGNLESLSPIAQQAISEITEESKKEAEEAKNAAAAHFLEAEALDYKRQIAENGTYSGNTQQAYDMINAVMAKYQGLIDNMKDWTLDFGDTSSKTAGNTKDAWVEAFEEEQRQLKHALEMNEITEVQYYEKLKDLNEKYFGEISGKHQKYLKEYQENEEEIYKGLKSVYEKVADYLKDAIEQGYEDAINAIKKEEKQIIDEIKAQLDTLKKEKQHVLDDIQNQIDGLKKKKEKVQDYWNSQIDRIKESNDALQKQNELLEKQQALQKAKSQKVMVMKGGKFQLGENESAVSQAEQELSETQDKISYEQQIAEMEKLRDEEVRIIDERIDKLEAHKDYMEKYYDDQIEALEQHRDEVEKQYEKQIEDLQEQLDAFKKGAEQQKKIEEARLAAQVIGVNNEADLFKISLANLRTYVEKYNALAGSIKAVGDKTRSGELPSGEGSFITAVSSGIETGIEGVSTQVRASGDSSFRGDEIALVGESPNAELVLGSHLNRSVNSGSLVHLNKGSGVVNAESTATLAGLLNGVVKPNNIANNRSTIQTFTFGNLTLPNVTDADSFVNTLSHKFNNYAIQYGNSRK